MKPKQKPGPGQESVWDYPRPPRLEDVGDAIRVEFAGRVIARTTRAKRVLETSHPPTYYIPAEDVDAASLSLASGSSFCEWKGEARYFDVTVDGQVAEHAAWAYDRPTKAFEAIRGYVCFYASKVDCYLSDEQARSQPGDFYGGWITSRVVGPFKGSPGTMGW